MTKLLMLDKDGTLVTPASGEEFVQTPRDQKPVSEMADAIALHASKGWKICIISNQGGVEAGYKSLKDCVAEMVHCLELFPQIERAYFCPDFEGRLCYEVWDKRFRCHCGYEKRTTKRVPLGLPSTPNSGLPRIVSVTEERVFGMFRKPNPGMLKLAIDAYAAETTLYLGDRQEDQAAALAANVPFLWASDFLARQQVTRSLVEGDSGLWADAGSKLEELL